MLLARALFNRMYAEFELIAQSQDAGTIRCLDQIIIVHLAMRLLSLFGVIREREEKVSRLK
ncbi:hypothetical protein CBW65_11215 [Tumebacillus avium]|uniref:Uncharacterized protein n=1 Tax=Tumebacillus avium TaxID=1903704 RepID=A0A1Y0IQ70_9BACL|nr:hypothetical protein CBW65_11215 [Tumebacillus avium]